MKLGENEVIVFSSLMRMGQKYVFFSNGQFPNMGLFIDLDIK